MGNILLVFLKSFLGDFLENNEIFEELFGAADAGINAAFETLAHHTLMIEKSIGLQLGSFNTEALSSYIMGFAVILIILKFLKKGFDTWIAWTDDPTADPIVLTTNLLKALVCALSFPILYGWLVDVVEDLTNGILTAMSLANITNMSEALVRLVDVATQSSIIFILVYVILLVVLYVKFLMRAAEIFIVRMGFPLACVGILDSNGGVFSGYVNKLFQAVLSVTVQVTLAKLSLTLLMANHLIWAIVFAMVAIKSPKLLQELVYTPGGGGGGLSRAYYASQMIRGLLRR